MATITNDEDSEILRLYVKVDTNSDITKLVTITTNENGEQYKPIEYSVDEVDSGVVMYKSDGRDVVKLISNHFNVQQGGVIKLDYLFNGVSGKRKDISLDVSRNGDDWSINNDDRNVKKLHFNSKVVFGKTIGIESITIE